MRRLAYKAFGEEVINTGTGDAPPYTYTGKERDASGLMYYGALYYDPALARFITPDTVNDRGTQGLNRYAYALNNPIRYNDPTGHGVVDFFRDWLTYTAKPIHTSGTRDFTFEVMNAAIAETGDAIQRVKEEPVVRLAGDLWHDSNLFNYNDPRYATEFYTDLAANTSNSVLSGTYTALAGVSELGPSLISLLNISANAVNEALTAQKDVTIYAFRGTKNMAAREAVHRGEVRLGHVATSFNNGEKIYGFGPRVGKESLDEVISALKAGKSYPGVVMDDTRLFNDIRKFNVPVYEYHYSLSGKQYWAARFRMFSDRMLGRFMGKQYATPPFSHGCYNCATYPTSLGLETPFPTGKLGDYLPPN